MNAYCMEDYDILFRCGRVVPTGTYETTRRGSSRVVHRFEETYKTAVGEFLPDEWKRIIRGCVEASGSQELLERIIEHCRVNCVWLKTDREREEYALKILTGRVYRYWKDFSLEGLEEKTAFVFIF